MINDVHEFVKPINFAGIKVPSLIIHGNMDGNVPFAQAEKASKLIPGAELIRVDNGWHLVALCPNWKEI